VSEKGRHERLGRGIACKPESCFLAAQRRGRRIPGRNLVVYALSRPEPERKQRLQNWDYREQEGRQCRGSQSGQAVAARKLPSHGLICAWRHRPCHHRSSCDGTQHIPADGRGTQRTRCTRGKSVKSEPFQGSRIARGFARAVLRGYRAAIRAGHRSGLSLHSFLFGLRRRSRRAMGSGARRDLGFAPRASLPPLRARWSGSGSHCLGRVQIA